MSQNNDVDTDKQLAKARERVFCLEEELKNVKEEVRRLEAQQEHSQPGENVTDSRGRSYPGLMPDPKYRPKPEVWHLIGKSNKNRDKSPELPRILYLPKKNQPTDIVSPTPKPQSFPHRQRKAFKKMKTEGEPEGDCGDGIAEGWCKVQT